MVTALPSDDTFDGPDTDLTESAAWDNAVESLDLAGDPPPVVQPSRGIGDLASANAIEVFWSGELGEKLPTHLVIEGRAGGRPRGVEEDSPSHRLLQAGIQPGDVVSAVAKEHDEGSLIVWVNDDPRLFFRLDATQLNLECIGAAVRLPRETSIELRVVAVVPGPYVVLSLLPFLAIAYEGILASGEPVDRDVAVVSRPEEACTVRLGTAGPIPLLALARGRALEPKESTAARISRSAAREWLTNPSREIVERLRLAGIDVRTGPVAELRVDRPLSFEGLPTLYEWLFSEVADQASGVAAAVETLYRGSHRLSAWPTTPGRAAPAEPGSADVPEQVLSTLGRSSANEVRPQMGTSSGPLLEDVGRVSGIYQGKRAPGPGLWVRLRDGAIGFIDENSLPAGRQLATYKQADAVSVTRVGSLTLDDGRVVLSLKARQTHGEQPVAVGAEFDDGVLLKEVPGLALFRFAGGRGRGAARLAEYRKLAALYPTNRTFRVRLKSVDAMGRWTLGLIDPARPSQGRPN